VECTSSEEVWLNDDHMKMLANCGTRFQAAGTKGREKIVQEAADTIEDTWTEDMEFDRDTAIGVCELSAQLNCHRRYGRDTETLSRKCKSRAEGLIRLRVSLSSKFPPLLYVREALQKR
jgi:hypothetical protein